MKLGFIDYYLDEWHALNYPAWVRSNSSGKHEVAFAYASIEGTKVGKRTNSEVCDELGLDLFDSIEELIERSDGIIILSPDNPEQHEVLSKLALESGKPVYIDKTFASDASMAKRIIELASNNQTPMYSTSALRYSSAYAPYLQQKIEAIYSSGPMTVTNYAIHQIEPILMLMGYDIKSVMSFGSKDYPSFMLRWDDDRTATMHFTSFDLPFQSQLIVQGQEPRVIQANDDFFQPFIKEMCQFFEDHEPKVEHKVTLKNIQLIDALKMAETRRLEWIQMDSNQ